MRLSFKRFEKAREFALAKGLTFVELEKKLKTDKQLRKEYTLALMKGPVYL